MKLEGKNILLISPEPWSNMKVSKHHYAEHLSKKNSVYFLNPPGNSFEQQKEIDQLFIIDYKPKFKGLHLLPQWISAKLIQLEYNELQENVGVNFDVVWSFDPSRFFNLTKIEAIKICHIVDWNQKFQRKILAKTADICFSTSSYLQAELGLYNKNSYFINHGYAERKILQIELPDQLDKRPRTGYIGNLNIKYLDWSLIYQVASKHSDVLFYFIGPYDLDAGTEKMKETFQLSNTIFLGQINAKLIPSYLDQMDILLLAYKAEQYPKQLANPHKMLEYLGSGKPIVSTHTKEYEACKLLSMSKNLADFYSIFASTINNLEEHSNSQIREARIALAKENQYEEQISRIESFINSYLS